MNRIMKGFAGILAVIIVLGITVLADGSAAIMETYTGDQQVSIYLKGASDTEVVGVQIATTEAEITDMEVISELDKPMQTLVMIDNSISISTADRGKIAQFLQNLISDRLNNEEVSIATFGEDLRIVTDYSGDYATLKQAIESISYQDQKTYFTDVLYDLLSAQYIHADEDVYCRIIVISDGVDNETLGYTKDELYSLLREVQVPIYTIGSANRNTDQLENMFALSRMTSADYFLLDEVNDTMEITEALKRDRDIIKLSITPSAEMMDGSKKTVRITLADDAVLTVEVTMPQQVQAIEPDAEPVEEEAAAETEMKPVVEVADEETFDEGIDIPMILFIVIPVVVVGVCVVLIILKKKKSNRVEFEMLDDNALREMEQNARDTDGKTEMIGAFHNNSDDGSTVMIWNQNTTYQVVLTDVNSPAKSFRVPLSQSIVVGRKKGLCDIALDYENSVSGKHCEILVKDGKFYIKDLQSSNGTYVNGSKVLTESEIFSGNVLKFGRLEMRFEVR